MGQASSLDATFSSLLAMMCPGGGVLVTVGLTDVAAFLCLCRAGLGQFSVSTYRKH